MNLIKNSLAIDFFLFMIFSYLASSFTFLLPSTANRLFPQQGQQAYGTLSMLSSPTTPGKEGNAPKPKKLHTVTVCVVPPPQHKDVWTTVSDMRRKLKDPGYFRWPPHANLLYPFLEISQERVPELVEQLHSATRRCPPFWSCLNRFGTFGGKQRGVLWLYPDSRNDDGDGDNDAPLTMLHQKLEEAFPMCKDQTKLGEFNPHMTLSHFSNLTHALEAQSQLESEYPASRLLDLTFLIDRIYLLERQGDSGQFLRVAEIGLGDDSTVRVLDPPQAFPDMPTTEEDWVYEERMKLKARRNKNGGRSRGGGRGRRRRSREPRIPDTPEEIARKRAERKAKRERLEQEKALQEIEQALDESPTTEA